MTRDLATPGTTGNSLVPLKDLVRKHRTQTKAAKAWCVSQSAISRLLSGERGSRDSEVLRAIAEAEGIPMESIDLSVPRRLQVIEGASHRDPRFIYDVADPHRMLKQLQSWFADLPPQTRMKRQVVRAAMRALFDESFDSVHLPSREWRAVMRSLEGLHQTTDRQRADGLGL